MAATFNYTWAQGEDLNIQMVYKEGPAGAEVPVDLTLWSLRMDIVTLTGTRRYTFNSADIADVDPDTVGAQPDSTKESTLGTGGAISILVPRTLTLPGGALYTDISAPTPQLIFNYDVFLRDAAGKQRKILKGTITVEKSYTLWA